MRHLLLQQRILQSTPICKLIGGGLGVEGLTEQSVQQSVILG